MISYDDQHPGTLIVDLRDDIDITIPGVTSADADRILDAIANRHTVRITGPRTGIKYVIEGYATQVARWEPDTA